MEDQMKKIVLLVALLLIFVSISYAEPVVTQNADGITYDISYVVPDGACFSMVPVGKTNSTNNVSLEQIPIEINTVPTIEIFGTSDAKNGALDMKTRTMTFIKVPASAATHMWNITIRTKDYVYWVHGPYTEITKIKGKKISASGFRF